MEPIAASREGTLTVGVALSFSVLVVGNYVFMHLYGVFGAGFCSQLKSAIKDPMGAVSGLMQRLMQLSQQGDEGSPLETQLALGMTTRKIERLLQFVRAAVHFAAFTTIVKLISAAVAENEMGITTLPQETIRYAFLFFVCQVFVMFPQYLTARTMQTLSLLNTLRMIGFILASPDQQNLVDNRYALNIMRVFDLAYMGGGSSSVLRHVIVSVVEYGAYMLHTRDRNMTSSSSASTFVLQQVGTTIGIVYVASLYWSSLEAELRATLQSKESSQAKETVQSLLSVMCDAVVHLNADLQICGPTPKLAALLLHNQSLDGRSFVDLMPPEDSERFCSHIVGTGPKDHAQSLNVQLRDSSGDLVVMRMFHTSFRDLIGDQVGHVIGVSDLSGQSGSWRPPQEAIAHDMNILNTSDLGHAHGRVGSASTGSSSWGDDASDVVMPLANAALQQEHPEVTVSFDALTADFTIMDCSVAFMFLCGLQPQGSGLLQWVKDGDRFFEWVEDHVNAFLNDLPPPSKTTAKITLRTAVSVAIGFEFRVICSLTVKVATQPLAEEDEEEEEMVEACARLTRVQRRALRTQRCAS